MSIAESGVDTAAEVAALFEAGFQGVLVGESLLRSSDKKAAVAGLLGRTVPCG
jgi:indole-3-glycerol phosphate synthase